MSIRTQQSNLEVLSQSETDTWKRLGKVWSQIFGNFRKQGLSFEWHAFSSPQRFDWSESFHRDSVKLCLNLNGDGTVLHRGKEARFGAQTVGYYCQADERIEAWREAECRHQFLTVEFSFAFLREHLGSFALSLHPLLRPIVRNESTCSGVAEVSRMSGRLMQLLQSLREPPVLAAAQPLWFQTKALELAAECFFAGPDGSELFCQRQKRVAGDRVQKVLALLQRDFCNPPSLEEIARAVGCSAFHLSRTFSAEVGLTIPQYIRKLRLERAAMMLKGGHKNVTEVAFEVGYSSLSHFSTAFHEMFGCCPGLYPLKPRQ